MKEDAYLKLYRTIQAHWLWKEKPFSKGQAWIDLLLLANFTEKKGKGGQQQERGKVYCSRSWLAEKWGWSLGKVDRFLDTLTADGMITKHSIAGGIANGTVLTIENYEKFNGESVTDSTADETTNETANSTTHDTTNGIHYKNSNKNSYKNSINIYKELPPELREAYVNFEEMRKSLKSPMTDKARSLLMSKVEKLSRGETELAVELLNQSIEHGWKTVYPLKENRDDIRRDTERQQNRVGQHGCETEPQHSGDRGRDGDTEWLRNALKSIEEDSKDNTDPFDTART